MSELTVTCSENSLSPGWHQAITWMNAGILLISTLETNLSEIFSEIHTFSLKNCIRKSRLRNSRNFVSASMYTECYCWDEMILSTNLQNETPHSVKITSLYSNWYQALTPLKLIANGLKWKSRDLRSCIMGGTNTMIWTCGSMEHPA